MRAREVKLGERPRCDCFIRGQEKICLIIEFFVDLNAILFITLRDGYDVWKLSLDWIPRLAGRIAVLGG